MPKKYMTENDRNAYNELMREYKALIQRKKRKYYLAIASDVKYLHERDPQGYWQFWKRHRPSPQNSNLLDAGIFTEYYRNLENKPPDVFFYKQFMKNIDEFISRYDDGISLHTNDVLNDILNAPISIDEIKTSLRRMKVNKAPSWILQIFSWHTW